MQINKDLFLQKAELPCLLMSRNDSEAFSHAASDFDKYTHDDGVIYAIKLFLKSIFWVPKSHTFPFENYSSFIIV